MEQRLIDANKLRAIICKWLKPSVPDETEMVAIDDIGVSVCMEIEEQPTVFTIPENPTNGDVIQAIFPDTEIEGNGSEGAIQSIAVSIGYGTSYFALDWWNAPYKKGDASE